MTSSVLDAFARDIQGYAGLGLDTVILSPRLGETSGWMETFVAPAVERLAGIG
ncbi:luciferase [Streptomyces fuscichromogenes]|uniref:luciferase n=1 Tax=Streptomyces fuscichromogenes TaxID=1324013 RepID=UPI00166FC6AA|nr:luciferase [Streptomyces fuscichromogenes]